MDNRHNPLTRTRKAKVIDSEVRLKVTAIFDKE